MNHNTNKEIVTDEKKLLHDFMQRLFLCKNKITKRRVIEVYDEDLRERLLSREQIQKLDLVTQTILFSVIEDVLEEREHDKQSLSTTDDDLYAGL